MALWNAPSAKKTLSNKQNLSGHYKVYCRSFSQSQKPRFVCDSCVCEFKARACLKKHKTAAKTCWGRDMTSLRKNSCDFKMLQKQGKMS
jgi:hypothetical protein